MSAFLFGKPWMTSLTAWGVVLFAGIPIVLEGACTGGMLSPESCAAAEAFVEKTGAVLVALGLRRAAIA